MQSDVSNTVSAVFRKNKSKISNQRQKSAGGKASTDLEQKGVNLVLKTVDHFGDHSKTLDCLFMNVNRVGYVDPTLDRCAAAFDWLSGADMYRSQKSSVAMNNNAEHHSMQKYYMPSAAAAIHLLCCIETRPDLTFSTRELADLHYQIQANASLVHRFVEGFAPRARSGIGGGINTVVSDVVPYGLWLLSAGDGKHSLAKPVSSVDILSSEEKLAFSEHVATLRALGLTYVKDDRVFNDYKSSNAPENVRLEPDIDKLVKFEHVDQGFSVKRTPVPPVLRELLAHGAMVAALREREIESKAGQVPDIQIKSKGKPEEQTTTEPAVIELTEAKAEKRQVARNFLNIGAAKAKEAKSARRAARVGFDRSKKVKLSNTGSGLELSKVIRFKFQKGFTQAVRAPCQMEDLM
jgi:chromosome transmission fidelity protein 18